MLVIWLIASVGLAATGSDLAWAISPFGFLPLPDLNPLPSPLITAAAQLIIGFGLWESAAYRFARQQRRIA
jgi:hypothetical protein